MSWYQHGKVGACPMCGRKTLHASRERSRVISTDWWATLGEAIFRRHNCRKCGVKLVSVHILMTPEEMVDQGIWPLTFSEPTR